MAIEVNNGCITVTGEDINVFQFLARKQALKLETLGMKSRGRSVYTIVKEEYGLKGNKKRVLEQMEEIWVALQQSRQETQQ